MVAARLQLISFDLDGTLVDTADEIVAAALATLDHVGLPRVPAHEVVELIGHGTLALMQGLLARVEQRGQPAAKVLIDAVMPVFDAQYAAAIGTTARPYAHGVEMLDALRGRGLKLACVTNKPSRHAMRVLQAAGLADRFDLVVGGDTLAHKKPHASVLRSVAQRLGVDDLRSVVHVGDSSIDVASARNAGAHAWAVSWGYNGGRPIEASEPDHVFDSFAQVLAHILGLVDPAGTVVDQDR